MMKFGASFGARSGAAGQLGAVFFLALGLFVACGNDTPEETTGGAGMSGRTGSAGKAGKGGEAGEEDAAGSAGADTSGGGDAGSVSQTGGAGGTGGTGGKAGSSGSASGGGKAGNGGSSGSSGGSGPVCGNNVLETGEACDDGNTKFGDSCSPTCTNVCENCEKDVCGAPDADSASDYQACFADGFTAGADTAKEGPGVGTKKNKLCQAVVACVKRTQCAAKDPLSAGIPAPCYCGTADAVDCAMAGKPNGACVEEIAAAAESREFSKVSQRAHNPQYALGPAFQMLSVCDAQVCSIACVQGKKQTACQDCAGIVGAPIQACYVNKHNNPNLSPELCGAAVDCALRTRCAANSIQSCYGVVTDTVLSSPGPCAQEFTAAGKGKIPGQILSAINGAGELTDPQDPLDAAVATLTKETESCKDICFPPSSGGAGGTGGAGGNSGTGGAASGGTGG